MKGIIIMIAVIFGCFIGSHAQEYKEGLLYDLYGNVKDMKLKTENQFQKKHVKFAKNGKCTRSLTYFDGEKYPLGYDMSMGGFTLGQKVSYDDEKRVETIINHMSQGGGVTETITYTYAENPVDTSEVAMTTFIIKNKKGEGVSKCEYSAYQYDDRGNWISRQVRQTDYPNTPDEKVQEYTETRTIRYY